MIYRTFDETFISKVWDTFGNIHIGIVIVIIRVFSRFLIYRFYVSLFESWWKIWVFMTSLKLDTSEKVTKYIRILIILEVQGLF